MAGLKDAARRYVRSVFAMLQEPCAEYEDRLDWSQEWMPQEGGSFILRPRVLRSYEACLLFEGSRLTEPPQAARLDAAMRADSRLGPFIGHLIGTIGSGATRVDEDTLRRALLWAVVRKAEGLTYSDAAFDEGYGSWREQATAAEYPMTMVAPIAGLKFEGQIDLGDGYEIDQMTDAEVAACLRMGVETNVFGPSGVAFVTDRVAVRHAWRESRGVYDSFEEEVRTETFQRYDSMRSTATSIVEALRVFKAGRVVVAGFVTVLHEGAMRSGGPSGRTRPPGEDLVLTPEEASNFASFWPVFKSVRAGNPDLDAAIRRFSYAGERTRRDDEIVDLVAAMESMLLSDIDDRTELRFRTALRGALFIPSADLSRREVLTQLRRAYDVRSSVAHGGTPRASALRAPSGDTLTLEKFVEGIEEIVRAGIRYAVDCVGAGHAWPPDWDGLIVAESVYPSP